MSENDKYKDICDLLVRAESFQEVLEGFHALLKTPFVLINENYQIFAACSPALTDDAVWNEGVRRRYWGLDFIAKVQEHLKDMGEKAILDGFSNHRRLFLCLTKDDVRIGYIVFLELDRRLEDLDEDLLRMLRDLVRKYLLSSYQEKAVALLSTDILFSGLVNGSFPDRRIFLEKAQTLRFDPEKEYRLLLVERKGEREGPKGWPSPLHALQAILGAKIVATTFRGDGLLFLLSGDLSKKEEASLSETAFHLRLAAVLSARIADLFRLPLLVRLLSVLREDLLRSFQVFRLYREEDYRLILPFVIRKVENADSSTDKDDANNELESFGMSECIDEKVQNIFRYDIENKTVFLDTIFLYLLHGRSLKEAAAHQFVHKNTISYRLNLAAALFGIGFEDGRQNLLYLESILRIYYLTGNLKKIFGEGASVFSDPGTVLS